MPGCVLREGSLKNELWFGLGLVVTGHEIAGPRSPEPYPAPTVYEAFGRALADRTNGSERLAFARVMELEKVIWNQRIIVSSMERSWSWRLTRPLRAARRLLGGRLKA